MTHQAPANIIGPMYGPEGSVGLVVNTPSGPANIALPAAEAAGLGVAMLTAGVLVSLNQAQETVGKLIQTQIPLPIDAVLPQGITSTGGAHFALNLLGGPLVGGLQLHFQCSPADTRALAAALIAIAEQEEASRGPIN